MYVCLCRGLREQDVQRAVDEGHNTPEALIARLGWDEPVCCGRCARNAHKYVPLLILPATKPAVAEAAV